MPAHFQREVADVAAQYPESRSAVMPALRLAQERHGGWLPPEAFVEVADALDLTPAYVKGVATFYDMFHLEPVGRRLVEVCTNICCGLRGAQDVLRAFERELGIEPGETSEDDEFTLRAVECIGGCGWPTVVAIDNVHRLNVSAEDVPAIVEELRS
jgi:NADH-quinone oxidoreductase E subunit